MNKWFQKFSEPVFFVTPDVKRGLGLEDILPEFHLICSYWDDLIPHLRKKGCRIFCLEEERKTQLKINNSGQLLSQIEVEAYIRENASKRPMVPFFKPSLKLDQVIADKGYLPIGSQTEANRRLENKVNLREIMSSLQSYLLPAITGRLQEISFKECAGLFGLPFVVQFGFGWAGNTTYFFTKKTKISKI